MLERVNPISPAQEKLLCYMQGYLDHFVPDISFLEELLAIMFIGIQAETRVVVCDYEITVEDVMSTLARTYEKPNINSSGAVWSADSDFFLRILGFYLLNPTPVYTSYTAASKEKLDDQRCWLIVSKFVTEADCYAPFFVTP